MEIPFIILSETGNFAATVALVGFGIVFFSLTLLFIVFSRLPKIIHLKLKKKNRVKKDEQSAGKYNQEMEGNTTAAIGLALYLYFNELHDEESNILTIKKTRKAYSPWSSKIYSVTQNWPRS